MLLLEGNVPCANSSGSQLIKLHVGNKLRPGVHVSQWVGAQGDPLRRFLTRTMSTHHGKMLKTTRLTLTLSEALEPRGS